MLGWTLSQIAEYFQSGGTSPEDFAVGLNNEFQPLEGHDIGQFPGLGPRNKMKEDGMHQNEAEMYQLVR